jgi:gamma-glutamylaminecyclotransferase
MCVIIIKQKSNIISKETLENSARINPHGLGITFLDTFETTYHKSSEYESLLTERPFIAHFRYATVGKVGLSNTHPFVCGELQHELLMQNGTIKGLGTKEKCDSKVLAESLGDIPRAQWKAELEKHDSRFVSINTKDKSFQIYNRDAYTKRDSTWYSKSDVLQENLVAVYGTLKKGYRNYNNYLRSARFLGSGETQSKYPLIISGLPFLLSSEGVGHNVEVDVFKVNDATFDALDRLEGHPKWYQRREVPIKMDDGRVLTCWIYFNDSQPLDSQEYHKTYAPKLIAKKLSFVPYEAECNQAPLWDDLYADEIYDTEVDDTPYCIECYNDLIKEEFLGDTFQCIGCGSEYTTEEVSSNHFNI